MKNLAIALLLSLAGGLLFTALQIPLPWLLGPMTAAFLGTRFPKLVQPRWPGSIRDVALILIGYSIGLSFSSHTLREMGHQLPTMLLMTTLLLVASTAIGFAVSKLTGISFPTVLMGSIPGGMNQMLVLAEETKGIDITVVTFLQVSRLMMIIFCVPLLVFSPVFGGAHSQDLLPTEAAARWGDLFPNVLVFGVVCFAAAWLAKRVRFPSAYLLGPMIATAVVQGLGLDGPALPTGVLNAAQLMIGTYVGLLLRPEKLENKLRLVTLAALSGAALLGIALGLCAMLTVLHPVSPMTAFLSMSPGGMDQMGIIAHEVRADIAIVTSYQIFRTWFIYFAIPPLIRLLFKRLEKRAALASAQKS
ncbi:AbrB family transcriptional regulator [Cohnella thailandensis]|uniref:AbrB family transcriptional regulator n=1 Tax=Cohnella thailandensis TaxID=557557 RepID=UPI001D7F3FF5|nr:membrane AbrB-like protein [Cohnella thailandensis]